MVSKNIGDHEQRNSSVDPGHVDYQNCGRKGHSYRSNGLSNGVLVNQSADLEHVDYGSCGRNGRSNRSHGVLVNQSAELEHVD